MADNTIGSTRPNPNTGKVAQVVGKKGNEAKGLPVLNEDDVTYRSAPDGAEGVDEVRLREKNPKPTIWPVKEKTLGYVDKNGGRWFGLLDKNNQLVGWKAENAKDFYLDTKGKEQAYYLDGEKQMELPLKKKIIRDYRLNGRLPSELDLLIKGSKDKYRIIDLIFYGPTIDLVVRGRVTAEEEKILLNVLPPNCIEKSDDLIKKDDLIKEVKYFSRRSQENLIKDGHYYLPVQEKLGKINSNIFTAFFGSCPTGKIVTFIKKSDKVDIPKEMDIIQQQYRNQQQFHYLDRTN